MKVKYGPYSPSRLDVAVCPFAFNEIYINNRRNEFPENLPQARGSVVHEVLEKVIYKMTREPDTVFTDDMVKNWVKESIHAHPAALEALDEVIDMVKTTIRRPPEGLTSDVEIERKIGLKYQDGKLVECGYDDENCLIRGRADVLFVSDDTTYAKIIDFKTQANIEPADTPQMGCYALAVLRAYPFLKEVRTQLYFPRYGSWSEEHVWTREDLDQVEDVLLCKIDIIEGVHDFSVAVPNGKCNYCPVKLECPQLKGRVFDIGEHGVMKVFPKAIDTYGDTAKAVELAGILNACEETASTIKKALQAHIKNSSAIAIPGKVYEFRSKEDINWSRLNSNGKIREQVLEIFRKHNVDPMTYMGFSATISKSIWFADNQGLKEELSKALPRKNTTTFGGHKI